MLKILGLASLEHQLFHLVFDVIENALKMILWISHYILHVISLETGQSKKRKQWNSYGQNETGNMENLKSYRGRKIPIQIKAYPASLKHYFLHIISSEISGGEMLWYFSFILHKFNNINCKYIEENVLYNLLTHKNFLRWYGDENIFQKSSSLSQWLLNLNVK